LASSGTPEKPTEERDAPLEGDPAREAVDAIRGYVYQVLRSVLAWIDLGEEEVLYLEGAEDFDRIGLENAEANQIKDTAKSGNLTLRSKSATDAIGNFWKHKLRNRDRRVAYRYLTTSSVGQERDSLFEGGGIALWQSTQGEEDESVRIDNVQKIAEYLCSDARLPTELREFLSKSTASQIFDELIKPFSWEMDAVPIPGVIDIINDKLVTFGSGKGVAAADSEAVLAALHSEAWLVATRDKDRALTKANFIRLFDRSTTISVPKAEGQGIPLHPRDRQVMSADNLRHRGDESALRSISRAIGSSHRRSAK